MLRKGRRIISSEQREVKSEIPYFALFVWNTSVLEIFYIPESVGRLDRRSTKNYQDSVGSS